MYRDDASNPAIFDDEIVRRHGGDPVCQAFGQRMLIQRIPQPPAPAGRSVPAWHTVAFLLIEAVPLHAACDPPLIELRIRVLDIETRPRLIRGTLTPRNPVIEGQVWCIFDAMLALQLRADAATAAARNSGSTAKLRLFFDDDDPRSSLMRLQTSGDADCSRTNNHDICLPRPAFGHIPHSSSRQKAACGHVTAGCGH
jgi:hypothetical protein